MTTPAPAISADQVRELMKRVGIREPSQSETRAAQLLDDIWNDPELGTKVRAKAKAKFDDIKLPDNSLAPIVKPLQDQVEALTKRLEERDKKEAEREAERAKVSTEASLQAAVDAAVKKFNLTDDGRKAMLERMIAQGSTDADGAAALIAYNAPKPASAPKFLPQKMDLFGSSEVDEKMRQLHTRPDDFLDGEIAAMLNNPDKYVQDAA